MHGERGQGTVEWIGIVLLVALALAALTRFAPSADGRGLATTLVHSVTHPAAPAADRPVRGRTTGGRSTPRPVRQLLLPPPPRARRAPVLSRAGPRLPPLPRVLRRSGRGAGAVWRRMWFACLVYERTRYAFMHPESRLPGYTIPFRDALRMANDCINPVDLSPLDLGQ